MPNYNVHLYREMRVKYFNVQADSVEEAALKVKNVDPELCDWENEIHECEGQSFSAIVDEVDPKTGELTEDGEGETPINFSEGSLLYAADDLLAACQEQHKAIDILFAMLIERDRDFMPTKSPAWDACVLGNAAIKKALDNCIADKVQG